MPSAFGVTGYCSAKALSWFSSPSTVVSRCFTVFPEGFATSKSTAALIICWPADSGGCATLVYSTFSQPQQVAIPGYLLRAS